MNSNDYLRKMAADLPLLPGHLLIDFRATTGKPILAFIVNVEKRVEGRYNVVTVIIGEYVKVLVLFDDERGKRWRVFHRAP